jgi:hypothetical protein
MPPGAILVADKRLAAPQSQKHASAVGRRLELGQPDSICGAPGHAIVCLPITYPGSAFEPDRVRPSLRPELLSRAPNQQCLFRLTVGSRIRRLLRQRGCGLRGGVFVARGVGFFNGVQRDHAAVRQPGGCKAGARGRLIVGMRFEHAGVIHSLYLQTAWIAHRLVKLVSKLRRLRAKLELQRRVCPGLGCLFGEAKLQGPPPRV